MNCGGRATLDSRCLNSELSKSCVWLPRPLGRGLLAPSSGAGQALAPESRLIINFMSLSRQVSKQSPGAVLWQGEKRLRGLAGSQPARGLEGGCAGLHHPQLCGTLSLVCLPSAQVATTAGASVVRGLRLRTQRGSRWAYARVASRALHRGTGSHPFPGLRHCGCAGQVRGGVHGRGCGQGASLPRLWEPWWDQGRGWSTCLWRVNPRGD